MFRLQHTEPSPFLSVAVGTTLPPVRPKRVQFFFDEDFDSVVTDNYANPNSFIINTFLEQRLAETSAITLNRVDGLQVYEGIPSSIPPLVLLLSPRSIIFANCNALSILSLNFGFYCSSIAIN